MIFIEKLRKLLLALRSPDTINKITKCDVLLICLDVDRGDLKFGLPYSKLLDSMQEDLKEKGYVCKQFAPPFSLIVGKKAWAEPYSANRLFWTIHLLCKYKKLISSKQNCSASPFDYAAHVIYKKVLEKSQPKFILVIGASSILCQEARKLKIPVLELLHGIGYDSVKWGWDNEPVENLPTHILSLDPVSTESFLQLNEKGIKIIEIPHPWYIRFEKGMEKSNIDPKWLERPNSIPRDKKVILISLTWGYDGDHAPYDYYANILPNGLLPEELLEVIKKTENEIFWCLRRHPVQVRNIKYDSQIDFLNNLVSECPNSEWEESTSITLKALIPVCDGHISMMSMTSYEAASMGVKSLLLCPILKAGRENANLFSDLEVEGYIVKVDSNANYIYEWVTNVEKTNPRLFTTVTQSNWETLLREFE
jgi:hypothetical protein